MEKVSNEVRVKDETICDSQSISEAKSQKPTVRLSIIVNKVKEEPIDNEMQTSKSHIESKSEEVEIKAEEKFSSTEEFAKNKTSVQTASIAFLNEETTQETIKNTNQA